VIEVVLPDVPVVGAVDPRRAQQSLLADIAALGQAVEPGSTITVAIEDGDSPAIIVAAEDVAVTS
jgi:hypothetical protein